MHPKPNLTLCVDHKHWRPQRQLLSRSGKNQLFSVFCGLFVLSHSGWEKRNKNLPHCSLFFKLNSVILTADMTFVTRDLKSDSLVSLNELMCLTAEVVAFYVATL